MNFGEAVDNIVSRVKRPDKRDEIGDAINRAIGLFATATFYQDLVEFTATLTPADQYVHQLAINASPFVRFRKIKYLRPTGYRNYLAFRDPSRVWQGGHEAQDVWYRSGNYLYFKLTRLSSTIEIGYYQYHAVLNLDGETDWMLDEMWPAVQAYAMAEIFDDIGNADEAAKYSRKWPILLNAYKEDIGDGVSQG